VVAQQILQIQNALRARVTKFFFMGEEIALDLGCAVFITMNPGYAGRSELPDNLKTLFRPVAMMIPDYALIAEISLFSFGFLDGRDLARKIVTTYKLCSEQLSSQDHYDYGMRAVKAVLMRAGALKQQFENENESNLMLRAIRDVNSPKFLSRDIPLFNGIIRDLFPKSKVEDADNSLLLEAIKDTCKTFELQSVQAFEEKIIQLYDMIIVRHGLMLVGQPFSCKTSAYRVLGAALNSLSKQHGTESPIEYIVISPKAITMGQLYGAKDSQTGEFTDGILAIHFRRYSSSKAESRKWMIFDGPVDALWIESMNTVLDDNRKLCLSSGEIIQMGDKQNMIFEVADLAEASPATVSRCGMVYMEPEKLTWRPLLDSYVQYKIPSTIQLPSVTTVIYSIANWLIPPLLNFVDRECDEYIKTRSIERVDSFISLLDSLLVDFHPMEESLRQRLPHDAPIPPYELEQYQQIIILENLILFSLIWSLGSTIDEESRFKFSEFFLKEIKGENLVASQDLPYKFTGPAFPDKLTCFEYVFDRKTNDWYPWVDTFETQPIADDAQYNEIIVPTLDTIRYGFILEKLVLNQKPVMFIGPTGTGKTAYIKELLLSGKNQHILPSFINFSARTSANQTQDIIESKLIRRKRGVLGAPVSKKLVFFVDDLNMPALEVYGAQPPIELLRQYEDHRGWYRRKDKSGSFIEIEDIQFVTAMGPPGGGRNPVTNRYTRHFNIISLTPQADESLLLIFSEIMDWYLKASPFKEFGYTIVEAAVSLYRSVSQTFLPRPSKSHYTFNLRDLAKVFQGIVQVPKANIDSKVKLMKLFSHESMRVFSDRLVDDDDRKLFDILLEDMIVKKFETEKSSVFDAEDGSLIFSNTAQGEYKEVTDIIKTKTLMEKHMAEYNEINTSQLDLVLFKFAIEHVARIHRIISQPLGNALLIGVGGSGRQSLTKLAAHAASLKLFQINLTKSYTLQNWKDDMKALLLDCGQKCTETVFLFTDTQIKSIEFLEDINNLLNTCEIPNLFNGDEKKDIQESLRKRARELNLDQTPAGLFNFFVERCKAHLHIVVCMSPVGKNLRKYIRMFPSFVNCTTIDWFSEWPQEALHSVAYNHLREKLPELPDEKIKVCVKACVRYHSSIETLSTAYENEMKRRNYVTPTSYLDLLETFANLYKKKQQELVNQKDKYDNGLKSISETEAEVAVMQEELEVLRPKLIDLSKVNEELSKTIERETIEANETRKVVEAEEEILNRQNQQNELIREDCREKLEKALPALRRANKALGALQKSHIVEVKSLKSPPKGVKLVMKAVCIIKGVAPVYVDEGLGKKRADYWEPAKKMMGERGFLNSVIEFDMETMSDSIVSKLKPLVTANDFNERDLRKANVAAAGLGAWVLALVNVHEMRKVVRPRQEALAEAEAQSAESLKKLNHTKDQLRLLQEKLDKLEQDKRECTTKQKRLEYEFENATIKLERAHNLINLLGSEKTRWEQSSKDLAGALITLTGDVLLSAGFVSYLGPFTHEFRNRALRIWKTFLENNSVPHSSTFSLHSSLGVPTQIQQWNIQGLPSDDFSIDNSVLISQTSRWPLFIDPQGQAARWIKNKEHDNGIAVIKVTDIYLIKTLEKAIQVGTSVILEGIKEELDPALDPLLLKQTFMLNGQKSIRLSENPVDYNDNFKLYMVTKLSNPHYLPNVSTKVTLVNFMITPAGLDDQLLGIVVAREKHELEEKKKEIVVQTAENQSKLESIENEILDMLRDSVDILEDDKAVNTLANSKQTANKIKAKQSESKRNEDEIDKGRLEYAPVAQNASNLFFVVSSLSEIDPMYQFSLEWYNKLYEECISFAPLRGNRIVNLIEKFTESLFDKICRSIFEKHKLLFAFLMCIQVVTMNGDMNHAEYRFLLTGGRMVESDLKNPTTWLIDRSWNELLSIQDLKAFEEFPESFVQDHAKWKEIYDSPEPEKLPLPGRWNKLTVFQKMLVLRIIRPDKLVPAISEYIKNNLGEKFIQPPTFDIEASFKDSSASRPLIFILSSGMDPMAQLQAYCKKINGDGAILDSVSLGQGQGKLAAEKINKAMVRGNWVVLQNCHLSISWLSTLERIIDGFQNSKMSNTFRLWLTSMPTPDFPISILQKSVKMTNEPPKGLRSNLKNSWNNSPITDETFFEGCDKPRELKKLLFGLCFFHAVVQERRQYGSIGWNIEYEFNNSDLHISLHQLRYFLDTHSYVPYQALVYLTGECNYGGRVTDDHDRRTLLAILSDFYTEEILEDGYKFSPSGEYYAPMDGSHAEYAEYIEQLPNVQKPEVFGLNNNADIIKDQEEAFNIFSAALLTQQSSISSVTDSKNRIVDEQAEDILRKLPPNFDIEAAYEKYPVQYGESMNTVLVQELSRFNDLLSVIRSSLSNLRRAIRGEVVMSALLEDVASSMFDSQIPSLWHSKSYPSLKPLGGYIQDLVKRCDFFNDWIANGPPAVFWLGGFYFTQSFLTGVKQNYARKHMIEIDHLTWEFNILPPNEVPSSPPPDGCYVRGIFLECARWDSQYQRLVDSEPKKLFEELPILHFRPLSSSQVEDYPHYPAPLYKTAERRGELSTTGHSTNFVMDVKIPSEDYEEKYWVKKGVALLLSP